jgi:FkbH-like protein
LESRILGLAQAIGDRSNSLILAGNFQTPVRLAWGVLDGRSGPGQRAAIGRLNARIAEALNRSPNGYVLDIDRLSAALGDSAANDPRNWHRARAPWKPALLNAIAAETVRHLRPLRGLNKKCLVLDCDNVLWGGVIGDLGVSNIALGPEASGSPYVSLQHSLRAIAARGVILCVCSKNEPEAVEEVFKQHPNMLLGLDDIAAWRVNRTDKAENIVALAEELNISTDSMVFVDDSPFECGRVRQALPEVEVVCLDGNPGNFQRIIEQLDYFDPLSLTEEDTKRTSLYRAESSRRSLANQSATLEDYLVSLEMVVEASKVDHLSLSRMSQLILKTNQFNLTTPRYTEAEIRLMLDDPDCIVAGLRVSDIYGDSGLVGAAIVFNKKTHFELDTFLMSCRVIGRGAEDAFLAAMTQAVAGMRGRRLLARYIPSKKNAMVKDFLPGCGFEPVESDDSSSAYALDSQAIPLAAPGHIRLVNGLCRQ